MAQYTASQLPSFLRKMELYKNNKLHCALEQGFLDFDATLLSEDVLNELKQLASVEEAASMADDSEGYLCVLECLFIDFKVVCVWLFFCSIVRYM